SIVCARFADGSCHFFEPSLNEHVNHILDVSTAPSLRITAQQATEARAIARTILEHFDVYGVLCVELFVDGGGCLLVNEIAPRPHNSGHLTIEACGSSQFEQQFRAVAGLPAGDVSMRSPAAMINLLGE
ncbi:MAG: ATP-grasp domain-containing protein, partial [Planctomycetaceae bacterium]